MIRQHVCIPGEYPWCLDILYDARPHDVREIIMRLSDMGCAMRHLARAEDLILSGVPNQGLTYSDKDNHHSLIVVGFATSVGSTINTLSHEINHAVDHISQYYGIPYASEANSYLTGDLAEAIWNNAVECIRDLWFGQR